MENKIISEIFKYADENFGAEPEYLWAKYPSYAVLRNKGSKKWFGVVMRVKPEVLGLKGDSPLDILDVKCEPLLIGSLLGQPGFAPAYHMNKGKWITVILDGTVPAEKIFDLLSLSHKLTK